MITTLLATAVVYTSILVIKRWRARVKAARAVKKVRMVYQRQDPYTRPFYVDYLRPEIREDIRDPQSRIGKIFRTRFRVPFVLLEDLYTKTLEMGFKDQRIDIAGRLCVPLASKILGVLRALGRATCFDGIAELAGGSAETHRIFFHKWCKMFARKYYSMNFKRSLRYY
jgi:hypothetical protein